MRKSKDRVPIELESAGCWLAGEIWVKTRPNYPAQRYRGRHGRVSRPRGLRRDGTRVPGGKAVDDQRCRDVHCTLSAALGAEILSSSARHPLRQSVEPSSSCGQHGQAVEIQTEDGPVRQRRAPCTSITHTQRGDSAVALCLPCLSTLTQSCLPSTSPSLLFASDSLSLSTLLTF